ncbi:receptor-type tyrosine-protein phosphatase alpha-like [Saccostrea echinata]|uniref:receptor-type tyrosine-protein phosphatase alpha-like n=1 Tax=Saccostrea echinata TaxID=191078 RepID=UPI002A7EF756|nr:receptor-type tyrosine-protein phosphatase alpha-like [Saccostrea echinata]
MFCVKAARIPRKGCQAGHFGPTCEFCDIKCLNRQCDVFNGSCIYGCSNSLLVPPNCNVCKKGFYGRDCGTPCGNCKTGTYCNIITGICQDGCRDHWAGEKCDVCKNGFYGRDCATPCENCKTGKHCNNITGICQDGCRDHWAGEKCDVCNHGFYGTDCREECGHCKTETYCNNITGICPHGCLSHWAGNKCDGCLKGFYGENCSLICGHCKNETSCNNITGACKSGCQKNWNGTNCEKYIEYLINPKELSSNAAVIGGTLSAIVFLSIAGVSLLFFYRRYRNTSSKRSDTATIRTSDLQSDSKQRGENNFSDFRDKVEFYVEDQSKGTNDEFDHLPSSSNGDNGYYNTVQVNTNMDIEDLQDVIVEKSKFENRQFLSEYKRFPPANVNVCKSAKKMENVAKNRFKTTFPYEHSRVILKDKWQNLDNDYINANYIKDFNGDVAYIGAQGPKSNTLADFWRMIWQEEIKDIVMLTNIIENGKNKCTQYWPNKDKTMNIGPCEISLSEENTYAFYILRKFLVQRKKTNGRREITHFHYTAWPDHGTPEEIGLVQFHKAVTKRKHSDAPLLVHCSAGVGRTGTFIGLDSLLKQGRKTGWINVFEFVKQMRDDRMTMVQTPEQYIFLHRALQCGFQDKGNVIQEGDLQSKTEELLNDHSPLNQRILYKEFKFLTSLKPVYNDEDKKDAKKAENKSKNFSGDILPISKFRPYLTSYVKGRNDFINAVIVSTFTNPTGFILTQKPLPETNVDLCRLCMDHEVAALVVLTDNDEETTWLPKRGLSQSCPPYILTTGNSGSTINGVSQDTLVISSTEHKRDIDVFLIPHENDDSLVKGTELLLEKEKTSKCPAVIISKDGAGPAGIFCVLYNALQQLRMDGEVDVFTTVRQIQSRRPEVLTKLEEYKRCYQLVSLFVSTEGIYANV